ncbi:MAG: response regulator transcription factor [Dorea sp.]|nr:response regulator transcription factor [Dorea sp.]
MIKILIADDQELLRQSLEIVLGSKENMALTGSVENGMEVLDSVQQEMPDVILMDIRMPKMDGVQCTKVIKERYPQIKIIILTTFDDDEYVFNALKNGASGYLLKGVSVDELVSAVETVYGGQAMINPDIAATVLRLFSRMAQSDYSIQIQRNQVEELTRSEWKIVEQVGNGLSNKEIAQKLNLSENTVKNYLSNILSKLNLRDRTQLAIWAVQTGKSLY